jgi:hypothetical protein
VAASSSIAIGIAPAVQVLPHPLAPRVDVLVNSQPFTTYLYLTAMARPALVSVRAADGSAITREDDGVEGDRPAGFWFAHGNVNGVDFTGTATRGNGAARQARGAPATRIVHRRVVEAVSSDTEGRLAVQTTWTAIDGSMLLLDDTSFTFTGSDRARSIDRVTRLAAVNGPVRLGPTARPQLAIQLADGFLERDTISGAARDQRTSADGVRGRWIALPGVRDGRQVTVALLEHPGNAGYPNLLRYRDGALELAPADETRIDAGQSLTFRYRLVIVAGRMEPAGIQAHYSNFIR